MGVCCHVYVPQDVSSRDVADVLAILLGAKKSWTEDRGARWVEVEGNPHPEGIKEVPGMDNLFVGNKVKLEVPDGFAPTFHYQVRFGKKMYGMVHFSSESTRIAIAIRLAKFFGGIVDYSDCDESGNELRFARSKAVPQMLADLEDDDFHTYQIALWDLEPLTEKEVERVKAKKYAAYG